MTDDHAADDCSVCAKHRGDFDVPGGALYADDLFFASHGYMPDNPESLYLGWLVIEPRRHIAGLAGLEDEEAQRMGLIVAKLSRALQGEGAEHVYAFVLGHGVPHLHVHLLPRYEGTPREYWGIRVDEWPEAPKGGFDEIAALINRLRTHLD